MSKAAGCGGAVAFAAALLSSCANAADVVALVAAAEDTQSVVVRDARDILHLYRVGEAFDGATWRLARVRGDVAYFQSQHPVAGRMLMLEVHSGERFDLSPPIVDDDRDPIPLSTTVRRQEPAQGKRP